MIDLNDVERFGAVDKQGMLGHALNLPQTCAHAWELAQQTYPDLDLSRMLGGDRAGPDSVKRIIIVGMGGSAIGGDLLASLVADECPCPILVQRGYDLPTFVDGPGTLVIGSSHSGNTEETLSAFRQARQRDASLLALTTGGKLAALAGEWDVPLLHYDYDAQPRAALGYSFTLLLSLLSYLGLVADKSNDLAEAVEVMRAWQAEIGPQMPVASNPAKRMAGQLMERMPVIYGAGLMEPVARRWKTQINENAKSWAFFEEMPELNHNAVVGFEGSDRIREWVTVIMLRSQFDSPRIQSRWRITRQILLQEAVGCDQVTARGESRLAQMLSLIHFGDLVSVYLAMANAVDPTPIPSIAYLKEQLA
jgi:glucose/mannose-6-phosphate isomerase